MGFVESINKCIFWLNMCIFFLVVFVVLTLLELSGIIT